VFGSACGSSSTAPTTPTPTVQTKVITVSGRRHTPATTKHQEIKEIEHVLASGNPVRVSASNSSLEG
jgi:hypothetical protein